jgi:hypothetical protein
MKIKVKTGMLFGIKFQYGYVKKTMYDNLIYKQISFIDGKEGVIKKLNKINCRSMIEFRDFQESKLVLVVNYMKGFNVE